jgi:hypothetical protein
MKSVIPATSSSGSTGRPASGKATSAATAMMRGSSGCSGFELRDRRALETLDEHDIGGRQLGEEFGQARLGCAVQFVHERPAGIGDDEHLGGAGLPVFPGVFAGLVDIEGVVGMFDGGDAQALPDQPGDDGADEGGLAGAAPAHEADDPRHVRARPATSFRPASQGRA